MDPVIMPQVFPEGVEHRSRVIERMARGLAAHAENRSKPEAEHVKPADIRADIVMVWIPFASSAWNEMRAYAEEIIAGIIDGAVKSPSHQTLADIEPQGEA